MAEAPTTGAKRSVFVSYAREDAASAQRIAEALRSHGVEVWFDQNELRGGDAWDRKIRHQIDDCTLFLPVISANTQERSKGYFRLEWKLAVEQTHLMMEGVPFLAPVVIDDTAESGAAVPVEFLKVQWTRLPGALPTPQFVEQIKRLLDAAGKVAQASSPAVPTKAGGTPAVLSASAAEPSGFPKWIAIALGVVVLGLVAFIALRPAAVKETPAAAAPATPTKSVVETKPATAAPQVSDKSIAVLPFVDMSQAKDQEYFSDGLSEELLNLLAKVPALQVTSRSSAFSYKGKDAKLSQIARELNVAHILEGSVRKSGNRLRITVQLIDARADKHLWSESYDRPLDDIFAVQDDIAKAVVGQLKVTLLGAAPKSKAVDPKAYALLLQARQLLRQGSIGSRDQSIAIFQQALEIDRTLAVAWTGIADAYQMMVSAGMRDPAQAIQLAHEAVNKALAIDPEFAPAHATLGALARIEGDDLAAAARHFEHALVLEPSNTDILSASMLVLRSLGRLEQLVAVGEYLVAHDPVDALGHSRLGSAYARVGRYDESIASHRTSLRFSPTRTQSHFSIGTALLFKGDAKSALAEIQQEPSEGWRLGGLAIVHHALGQKAQSDAALADLIKKYEKGTAWNIAYVCAFRGEFDRAFEWLDKAVAYRDVGVSDTAVTPYFGTEIQKDPRWLPFLRKIKRAPEQLAAIKFDLKLPGK